MMLTKVTYYTIPRDGDGRRGWSAPEQRLITMAMRWQPEIESCEIGRRVLNRLVAGDDISHRHIEASLAYLRDAIAYYEQEAEPYPGRNDEAIDDLRAMLDALSEAVST